MAIAAVVVALYQHADVTKISSRVLNEGTKRLRIFSPNVKIHVLFSPHYMPTQRKALLSGNVY
jgi:hypothetical protein